MRQGRSNRSVQPRRRRDGGENLERALDDIDVGFPGKQQLRQIAKDFDVVRLALVGMTPGCPDRFFT
jgi:hypothetical protein